MWLGGDRPVPAPENPDASGPAPDVSIVVPSHDRPLRLRGLLDALAEQTLARERFEVIVVHDSSGSETDALLRSHALAETGALRHLILSPGSALPSAKRNLGWRAARAPLVAFTDDDCRPPPDWLEVVLAAVTDHPGAIVQGTTLEDPDEARRSRVPFSRSQRVIPPTLWAEMCNIVYPRSVLERVGGLDEGLSTFEDTDVALRAREQGVPFVPRAEIMMFHAVHTPSVLQTLRGVTRWRDAPAAVKRHPRLRQAMPLRIFWTPRHAWLAPAVAGIAASRRWPAAALLSLPWARHAMPFYGRSARGLLRSSLELPVQAAVDAGEMAVLARYSLRHRSLLL